VRGQSGGLRCRSHHAHTAHRNAASLGRRGRARIEPNVQSSIDFSQDHSINAIQVNQLSPNSTRRCQCPRSNPDSSISAARWGVKPSAQVSCGPLGSWRRPSARWSVSSVAEKRELPEHPVYASSSSISCATARATDCMRFPGLLLLLGSAVPCCLVVKPLEVSSLRYFLAPKGT